MRLNKILFSLFLIVSNQLFANDIVTEFVSKPITQNATISLLVKDTETHEIIAEYRRNSVTPPASVMKLITTATALEMLGPEFKFETYLETDGTIEADGTLNGNLYIRGTGDPTLGSYKIGNQNFMHSWLVAMKRAGILRIKGRVIADVSFFDNQAINPQWIWEDIGNYYAPGIHALAYLDNTMNIQLISGPINTKAQVIKTLPQIDGLEFDNQIMCTSINHDGAFVHGLPFQNKRYLVGSVPSNQGIFGLRGDIPNPGLLLAQHFTRRLKESGIFVTEDASYDKQMAQKTRTVIYTHKSPCLQEIITLINFQSNNLYAEQLFRYLGSKIRIPTTTQNSIDVIKQFWKSRLVDFSTAFVCDGSGLAPQNSISADLFVDLLEYMQQTSDYKDNFLASLPVSGTSGTLTGFLRNTTLHGKVAAKSGTTSRIKSYAGYIDAPNGKKYVFAIMVNNGAARAINVQREIERFLLNVCN